MSNIVYIETSMLTSNQFFDDRELIFQKKRLIHSIVNECNCYQIYYRNYNLVTIFLFIRINMCSLNNYINTYKMKIKFIKSSTQKSNP